MPLFKRNKDKGKRLADGSGDERPVGEGGEKPLKKKRPASESQSRLSLSLMLFWAWEGLAVGQLLDDRLTGLKGVRSWYSFV